VRKLIVCLVALVFSLTACSGGSGDSSGAHGPAGDQASPSASATMSPRAVRAFFRALGSADADAEWRAVAMTATDSVARDYSSYFASANEALRTGGGTLVRLAVTRPRPGTWRLCGGAAAQRQCYTYADVAFEGGRVASFTVDGEDLSTRLVHGDGSRARAGKFGTIETQLEYQTTKDTVWVIAEVHNTSAWSWGLSSDTAYLGANGHRSAIIGQAGPAMVSPHTTAKIALAFSRAKVGGRVAYDAFSNDAGAPDPVKVTSGIG